MLHVRRGRWISFAAAVATLAVAGCAPSGPDPIRVFPDDAEIPIVGEDAFLGEIVDIEDFDTAAWRSEEPSTSGGPSSSFNAGRAVLVLRDGTRVEIREGTPAGNDCFILNPYEASLDPVDRTLDGGDLQCVVAGVLDEDGNAAWMETRAVQWGLDSEYVRLLDGLQGNSIAVGRSPHVGVPPLGFRMTPNTVRRYCDEVEFVGAWIGEGVYASSQSAGPSISIDPDTLTVVGVLCV